MPPKAAKKKGGKKKKGPDEREVFDNFLNDMFYMSRPERAAIRNQRRLAIRDVFRLFQERGRDVMDVRELGVVVRELGLNPSQQQLASIQTLVEDPENPSFIPLAALERVLLDVLETKELRSEEVNDAGVPQTRTSLVFTEPERTIQEAFDVLWDALGRKVDHDQQRFIDSDALRELLMSGDMNEAFSEDDVGHFLTAAQEVGTANVNEALFLLLCTDRT